MTAPPAIVPSRVLAAAWALWRHDRDLLVRIAVPFVLLPSLALQLLVPHPAIPADAATIDVLRAQWRFAGDHAAAYLLAAAVGEYGRAALLASYVDPHAPDVRAVLIRAARIWPRFLLLALLVEAASLAGLLLFVVPALIVVGRTLPAAAALVAEQPASATGALRRAIRLTAGQTLPVAALAALLFAARLAVLWPFAAMDEWLRALNAPNPVALAVIDAAAASATMLVTIAGVLVAAVLYRSLARPGEGVGAGASIGT